jgi:hypothetical protein
VTRTRLVAAPVAALALLLHGCAAIPVAALVGGLLEAGGGAVVKTGTEYTASGAAIRTFAIPLADVHSAAREALRRTDVSVRKDEITSKGYELAGVAERRKIRIRLMRLTSTLTRMELVVKRNLLASDKATASELLAQTEEVLSERRMFELRAGGAAPE